MRKIETKVYTFDELSDTAKEKARGWHRSGGLDYDWWDMAFDEFATVADILGIDLRQRPVKGKNGNVIRHDPAIYFSGFWSQGDGASFEGEYRYKKGSCKAIREYAPQDTTLHKIADALRSIQAKNFYQLHMSIGHRGRYSHEMAMHSSYFERLDGKQWTDGAEGDILEELRNFARWIYSALEHEYEWLNADEQADESIRTNEYEFTEDGEIF